jgi:hypothetical protein
MMNYKLSITGAAALMSCPYRYWIRRQYQVQEPAIERVSLDMGGAVHIFAKEKRWQSRPDLADKEVIDPYVAMRKHLTDAGQDEVTIAKTNALCKAYENVDVFNHPDELILPEDLVAVEPFIEGKAGDVPIHGRIDAILKNGLGKLYCVETKTTGTLKKSDSRDFNNPFWRQYPDAQLAIYVLLARQNFENVSNEVLLDIIIKPALRQTKSDDDKWGNFSPLKFEVRYRKELEQNVGNYFIRQRIHVPERLIEGVTTMLNEVWIKYVLSVPENWDTKDELKDMLRNWCSCYNWMKNTLCPLKPHCYGGTPISQLFKRNEGGYY